jgi:hypothetical protein
MSLFGSMSGHTSKEIYSGESGFETYGLMRRHPASQLHLHMPEQRAHATVRAYAHYSQARLQTSNRPLARTTTTTTVATSVKTADSVSDSNRDNSPLQHRSARESPDNSCWHTPEPSLKR